METLVRGGSYTFRPPVIQTVDLSSTSALAEGLREPSGTGSEAETRDEMEQSRRFV